MKFFPVFPASIILFPLLFALAEVPDSVYMPPEDAGLINVREHGVKGDGKTDDTAAITALLRRNRATHPTFYFPPGTYLVGDTIDWQALSHPSQSVITWQGAGRDQTKILLVPHCEGFQNSRKPKPMVRTGRPEKQDGKPVAGMCYLFDMSFLVGRGNRGAVALDYASTRQGGVIRVDVLSEDRGGYAGLALTGGARGPCLVQDVRISGFDYGIRVDGLINGGIAMERISLRRQRVAGIENRGNTIGIRRLFSRNVVPAVVNTRWAAHTVLLDSNLRGGDMSGPAIKCPDGPTLIVRNTITDGFAFAVIVGEGDNALRLNDGAVDEFVYGRRIGLFGAKPETLGLPILESPQFFDDNSANWARVGVADAEDSSAAFQEAVDSGATTVYVPFGTYTFRKPVVVRGGLRRMILFNSMIRPAEAGGDIFKFENEQAVVVERGHLAGRLINATSASVAIRHGVVLPRGLISAGGDHTWFLDSIFTSHQTIPEGTKLYARQWRNEPSDYALGPGFRNEGMVWVLGYRTEYGNTNGFTGKTGSTEILASLSLPIQGFENQELAAWEVEDGRLCVSWNLVTYGNDTYQTRFRETRDGKMRQYNYEGSGSQQSYALFSTGREPE